MENMPFLLETEFHQTEETIEIQTGLIDCVRVQELFLLPDC